jgi:hypothetical protein
MADEPTTQTRELEPCETDRLIALADSAARTGSREYKIAAAMLTAAEQEGFIPDGSDLATRVRQRKAFIGRALEAIAPSDTEQVIRLREALVHDDVPRLW